ncbi:cell wall-binding repeat-containing protein [Clostridium sp. CF012]|uniref:cell wall-binding repeat-containing protein n=1 Tax=Clostridium sp. CF012 TaxID=2843319 RepID=UPI001C0B7B1E|nr:cell wall-binding repeat-containing protein [Clostridium sp. CF012]MBU3143442.1 cell wall-binding repeat-containing protein [Clostridium sp. CF012]
MNRYIKRVFSLLVILCLILSQTNVTSVFATNLGVGEKVSATDLGLAERISGNDRYKTAVEISKKGWAASQYAVIARGDDFADALCAGPLANKFSAPILLTPKDSLNSDVILELKRLGVESVFIIGGTGAVSTNIENSLKIEGITKIERIYGLDRYETSVKIAEKIGTSSKIVFATGENFPDALSISAVASKMGMPIILTQKNSLPDKVKQYMLNKKFDKIYIIGGPGVIIDGVKNLLSGSTRIGGKDRFDTNTLIMAEFESVLSFNKIFVAVGDGPKGDEFADALSGSVLAAKESSPMVLVNKTLPEVTGNYLKSKVKFGSRVIVLGGEAVVSSKVADKIIAIISEIPIVIPADSYIALGDSITYGMSAEKDHGYVDLFYNNLKSFPGNVGIKLMNLGKSGDKSSDLLSKLQNDATTKNSVSKAKVITISVGGNNLLSPVINGLAIAFNLDPASATFASDLELAISNPNNQQKLTIALSKLPSGIMSGVKQFGTDWVYIIGMIKMLAPNADVYVTTLYNPLNHLDPLYNIFDQAIQGINTTIRIPNTGYKVADVYTAFHDYQGIDPLTNFSLFTGNLDPHPTTKGHEVIYQCHVDAKEILTVDAANK